MKINYFSPEEASCSGIHFFNESGFSLPVDEALCQKTSALIQQGEQCRFQLAEIVFVDEEEIKRINQEHLERTYVTDIISFRYDEDASNQTIEGTLFCCASRIREQAEEFNETEETEFMRVVIHGLLHLAGYEDQSKKQKKEMRKRENFYLQQLK